MSLSWFSLFGGTELVIALVSLVHSNTSRRVSHEEVFPRANSGGCSAFGLPNKRQLSNADHRDAWGNPGRAANSQAQQKKHRQHTVAP